MLINVKKLQQRLSCVTGAESEYFRDSVGNFPKSMCQYSDVSILGLGSGRAVYRGRFLAGYCLKGISHYLAQL